MLAAAAVDAFIETNFPLVLLSNLISPSDPFDVVVSSLPATIGPENVVLAIMLSS
jgi:hypothetical protein